MIENFFTTNLVVAAVLCLGTTAYYFPLLSTGHEEYEHVITDIEKNTVITLNGQVSVNGKVKYVVADLGNGVDSGLLGLHLGDAGIYTCSVHETHTSIRLNNTPIVTLTYKEYQSSIGHGGCGIDGDKDRLWFATGDGAGTSPSAEPYWVQDTSDVRGKLFSSNLDGSGLKIEGVGLRNPFKVLRHVGVTYVMNTGEDNRESVFVADGKNFGWPYWEGSYERIKGSGVPKPSEYISLDHTKRAAFSAMCVINDKVTAINYFGGMYTESGYSGRSVANVVDCDEGRVAYSVGYGTTFIVANISDQFDISPKPLMPKLTCSGSSCTVTPLVACNHVIWHDEHFHYYETFYKASFTISKLDGEHMNAQHSVICSDARHDFSVK